MQNQRATVTKLDPVWSRIVQEAQKLAIDEPVMASLAHTTILNHAALEQAMAFRLSLKLASAEMPSAFLSQVFLEAYSADPEIMQALRSDIVAVFERDPACHRFIQPVLFFKGFQAVQCYRVAHWLWKKGRKDMAYFVQMRCSEAFGVDIHPGAKIGKGLMIDHAHSVVIGETAVVGDNVSMLHSVTLGGTGKEDDDRHPKIGDGVLIGAGAKVLGNINVGYCSRIASGSVVLKDIPPCKTVAGVPARIVGEAGCDQPSITMDQLLEEYSGDQL
jgi:serine O-acetyltransferase